MQAQYNGKNDGLSRTTKVLIVFSIRVRILILPTPRIDTYGSSFEHMVLLRTTWILFPHNVRATDTLVDIDTVAVQVILGARLPVTR